MLCCCELSILRRLGLFPTEGAVVAVEIELKMLNFTVSGSKEIPGSFPGGKFESGFNKEESKGSKSCSLPSPLSFIRISIKSGPGLPEGFAVEDDSGLFSYKKSRKRCKSNSEMKSSRKRFVGGRSILSGVTRGEMRFFLSVLSAFALLNLNILRVDCAALNNFRNVGRVIAAYLPTDFDLNGFENHKSREFKGHEFLTQKTQHNHHQSLCDTVDFMKKGIPITKIIQSPLISKQSVHNPAIPTCNGLLLAQELKDHRLGNIVLLIYLIKPFRDFIMKTRLHSDSINLFKNFLRSDGDICGMVNVPIIVHHFWELLKLTSFQEQSKGESYKISIIVNNFNEHHDHVVAFCDPEFNYLFFEYGNVWYGFNGIDRISMFPSRPRMQIGKNYIAIEMHQNRFK